MTYRILSALAVIGATLQATVAFGFLLTLTMVGLTAFGILPAPM